MAINKEIHKMYRPLRVQSRPGKFSGERHYTIPGPDDKEYSFVAPNDYFDPQGRPIVGLLEDHEEYTLVSVPSTQCWELMSVPSTQCWELITVPTSLIDYTILDKVIMVTIKYLREDCGLTLKERQSHAVNGLLVERQFEIIAGIGLAFLADKVIIHGLSMYDDIHSQDVYYTDPRYQVRLRTAISVLNRNHSHAT